MHPRLLSVFTVIVAMNPIAVFAAPSTNLDQEYEQVRRIALRDPKVKASFENANQRLEAKIAEIDPALKGYAKGRSNVTPSTNPSPTESTVPKKPFMKPSKPTAPTAHSNTHVIASGDTLSTIAAHYKVTVAELEEANPTVDEKKLQVGDKLTIPSHHQHATKTSAKMTTWDRFKRKF